MSTDIERLREVSGAEADASILTKAISLASDYHGMQIDKCGKPYILHPLRVMLRCNTHPERIVAVLHDLLEDTKCTEDKLRACFAPWVVDAVVALTKNEDETYNTYIARVLENPLACRVKLADLEDNMDIHRVPITFAGKMPGFQRYAETHLKIRKALANQA